MKKLLGISLIAVLTAAPAFAATEVTPLTADAQHPAITSDEQPMFRSVDIDITNPESADNNMASAGYVKGAYNAAITAVNNAYTAEKTRAEGVEGNLTNLTTTDKTNLVSAINEVKGQANDNETHIGTYDATKGILLKDAVTETDKVYGGTVAESLKTLKSEIDGLNTSYADVDLSNISEDGKDVIKDLAKSGDFTKADGNGFGTAETIDEALTSLDSRVVTNTGDIETLNGNASVDGSVANKIKLNAAGADYVVTGKNYTDGTASTVTGALDDLDTRVNTNTGHIGTIGNLTGAAQGKADLVQAINAVSSSMTDDFAKQPNVQATIANSTVDVMTVWGSDNVKKRHINAATYVEDTNVEGIMTGEDAVNGKLTD